MNDFKRNFKTNASKSIKRANNPALLKEELFNFILHVFLFVTICIYFYATFYITPNSLLCSLFNVLHTLWRILLRISLLILPLNLHRFTLLLSVLLSSFRIFAWMVFVDKKSKLVR